MDREYSEVLEQERELDHSQGEIVKNDGQPKVLQKPLTITPSNHSCHSRLTRRYEVKSDGSSVAVCLPKPNGMAAGGVC